MNIRKATINDFEEILKLNKELFLYEKKFTDTFNEEWAYSNQGKEYFAKRIVNSNSIFLLLEDQGELKGYILGFIDTYVVRKISPIAEIENLFIKESKRNQGWGRELVEGFIKIAKEQNVERLKVRTYSDNIDVINFYKKFGFKELLLELEADI